MEQIYTQSQLINQILRIGHGNLSIYTQTGMYAVTHEPELFGHLIAWNQIKGQVRDSKVALPVLALRGDKDAELYENAAAHLCKLSPRDLVRAGNYHRQLPPCKGGGQWMKDAVNRYLRHLEQSPALWDRVALQHRKSLKTLYAVNHIKPSDRANRILFNRDYPQRSVFVAVKNLAKMKPVEAAGTILNKKIPFLVAVGALGGIKDKPDVILALIERMTRAELMNNTAMLERWGVMENQALKAAYTAGLEKQQKQPASMLKADKAAKHVKSKKAKAALQATQEKTLDANKGIEGDWLVLGDRSGSMHTAIELAREVAAFLARSVKGAVHLVMFNTTPYYFDVTGKSLDEIKEMTRRHHASGGTAIGCGLDYIIERGIEVGGIAICSDGGENTNPTFHAAYKRYTDKYGTQPNVYLWHVPGETNRMVNFCERAGVQVQTFEIGRDVDYYALPQIALTMRTNRYSLVAEILDTRLLTFNDVFKKHNEAA